ncbi:acyl-ACP--UDP-N-acetylglucosamine O-acyltransferase [Limnoglobus roseus]|uniref:Acyl-ACP--UDP-N-acetylglucosamine O-acyltransferase n=1 Tax=Limnoglobus roseus TaxID=2598579 RepID=A0A5C1A6C2_9BACT|nr:acyl-ACP--UDP-N-acetylglucosamine O-acyltransferase [Limnoglobus roseus]QEL13925.1 acyl-ACP--UDP-N-acetylglucosamine O-acyltransferase [Limnoglobus roseus]
MSDATTPLIHPTAVISAEAELAADVRVGPYAVIDGPVRLGAGCVVRAHAQLVGPLTAGEDNDFGRSCVIGERPQHLAYKGEPTGVTIGHRNTFREHVTIHRGMPVGAGRGVTTLGDGNYLMCGSHLGHDCIVGNNAIIVNSALLGGHCEVGDRALISGNAGIHQNCRIGRLALVRGLAIVSMDVPPFWIVQSPNSAAGVNLIGMRRAGIPSADIQAVRKAFNILYRGGLILSLAVAKIEADLGASPTIQELIQFIRTTKRGIPGSHRHNNDEAQAA